MCACVFIVMSDSATPWTIPARLLWPWDFPDKNTRVDCHFLLQGIFMTQGSNLHLLPVSPLLAGRFFYHLSYLGSSDSWPIMSNWVYPGRPLFWGDTYDVWWGGEGNGTKTKKTRDHMKHHNFISWRQYHLYYGQVRQNHESSFFQIYPIELLYFSIWE